VFNKEKIARQALQRADETEKHIKCMWRRTKAIAGVCVSSVCVFLIIFSRGISPQTNDPGYMQINDPQIPLAAAPSELLAESTQVYCPVCGHEFEENETP